MRLSGYAMLALVLVASPVQARLVEGELVYRLPPIAQKEAVEVQILAAEQCMLSAMKNDPRLSAVSATNVSIITIIDDAAAKCADILKGMMGMYNSVRGADTGSEFLQNGFVEKLKHPDSRLLPIPTQ